MSLLLFLPQISSFFCHLRSQLEDKQLQIVKHNMKTKGRQQNITMKICQCIWLIQTCLGGLFIVNKHPKSPSQHWHCSAELFTWLASKPFSTLQYKIVKVSIFTGSKQAIGFFTVCILKPCRQLFKSIRATSPHWWNDAGRALVFPLYCYHTNSCLMLCIIPVCRFCPNLTAFKCI